jgi:MerR family transcriptional regulator, light-induced transcriptional regulator
MENRERAHRQIPEPIASATLGAAPAAATDRQREARPAARPRPDRSLASFPSDVELFPIRTVSSLTGVNSITLRAWERRYGLVRPVRTPTGHRLYRRDEIDLIHRVVALLDKGISISQVQRVLSQSPPSEQKEGLDEDPFWTRYRRRLVSAVTQFDEDALEEIYHEALGVCAISQITERLLLPVSDELTRRRETEGSIAHERFFGTYLRSRLGTRFLHRARGLDGPRVLCGCVPGEHNETGMLLFALTAHEMGMRSVLLGADTPLTAIQAAAIRAQCQAIVLSGSNAPPPEVLAEQLPKLVAATGMLVFVHGAISTHRREQVVAGGGFPLGNDLVAGVKRIADVLRTDKR